MVWSMNVFDDEWGPQEEDWSGGGGLAKRLVERGPLLGASVYELGPGNVTVYHAHHVMLRRPTAVKRAG